MEIEENDGREPRPTSENQEISKEPAPQNKPERQRPAYRATREGGGYKLDSKGRPTPPLPPRPRSAVRASRTVGRQGIIASPTGRMARPTKKTSICTHPTLRRTTVPTLTSSRRTAWSASLMCRKVPTRIVAGITRPIRRGVNARNAVDPLRHAKAMASDRTAPMTRVRRMARVNRDPRDRFHRRRR